MDDMDESMDGGGAEVREVIHYVHIGLGKTGTTSIQSMLRANAERLAEKGILYPGLLFELTDRVALPQQMREFNSLAPDAKSAWLAEHIRHVNSLCLDRGYNAVVWSWEGLIELGPQVGAAYHKAGGSDVRVIVYVRRQDDWFQSAYLQWGIRHKTYPGPVKDFAAWYATWKWRGDYRKVIGDWASWLARESVYVRVYEPEQLPRGLHHDFLSLLPISDQAGFETGKETYLSVNRDLINLYREYHDLFDGPKDPGVLDRLFNRALVRSEHEKDRHRVPFLSPAERIAIVREFAASNGDLARDFMGRPWLFLNPTPSEDEPFESLDSVDAQGLARLSVQVFVYLADEIEKLKKDRGAT